jgi:phosphate transport system protein
MNMSTHTDTEFEAELQMVRDSLHAMSDLVENMLGDAIEALVRGDEELAASVPLRDQQVNRAEIEVDKLCTKIIALRQPAACDLRFIISAFKVVTDLERVGDLATHIADQARRIHGAPGTAPDDLTQIVQQVRGMLHEACASFVESDAARARAVIPQDDGVDLLFRKIVRRETAVMREDPTQVEIATRLLFVAKHLERIADHATNLAEMTIYVARGEDVRHPFSRLETSTLARA